MKLQEILEELDYQLESEEIEADTVLNEKKEILIRVFTNCETNCYALLNLNTLSYLLDVLRHGERLQCEASKQEIEK